MKLGIIKAEAMRLMHVDRELHEDNVDELSYDDNYSDLYNSVVGAINRCFGDLEMRRILPLGRVQLNDLTGKGRWRRFRYDQIPDLFEPVRLVVEADDYLDDDHPFFLEGDGSLRVDDFDPRSDYYLFYHKKIERITTATANNKEICLPDALVEAIPWYVMGDVYRADEIGEAGEARNFYEAMVAQYVDGLNVRRQGTVRTVYGGC